jgi:hypothetical protein
MLMLDSVAVPKPASGALDRPVRVALEIRDEGAPGKTWRNPSSRPAADLLQNVPRM